MDKLHLDQHISNQFNSDLEALRTKLLEMGGLVAEQLEKASRSLESADGELAEQVIDTENTVDAQEVEIDHECMLILARRQPAASDLRLVLMVTRATRDLERIGDEAKKIAKMAIALNDGGAAPRGYVEIRHISSSVLKQVHLCLDAFARFDVHTAMTVAKGDKLIDREYKSAVRELITYMMEDPRSISRVMNILWALRALERIGDHAQNIAEHVIYLVLGMDVRHVPLSELEEKLAGNKALNPKS